MSKEIHFCKICGTSYNVECHHIIPRSECKPLENCKLNFVYLCHFHHQDHREGVHHNRELDRKIRLELFQKKIELLFDSEFLTVDDIRQALEISENAATRLCKTILPVKGMYKRIDVIRACMGGKLIIEGDI